MSNSDSPPSHTRYFLVTLSEAAPYFTGASSPERGEQFELRRDQPNVIGRHPDATICVHDARIARAHCEIKWRPEWDGFQVEDTGARNASSVNGQMLTPYHPVPIRPGETLMCGVTIFRLEQRTELED